MHPSLPTRRLARWLALHVAVLMAIGIAGLALEWWRLGLSDDAALGRVRAGIEADFDRRAARLRDAVGRVLSSPLLSEAVVGVPATRPALFELLEATPAQADDSAITIHDSNGDVLAWRGRASDLPFVASLPDQRLFVAPGVLGWRLIYADAIWSTTSDSLAQRLGTVVAEDVLTLAHAVDRTPATSFELPTAIGPATLWPTRFATDAADEGTFAFTLHAQDQVPLLEVRIERQQVTEHRAAWRRGTQRAMAGYAGLMALFGLLTLRMPAPGRGRGCAARGLMLALATAALAGLARVFLGWAIPDQWRSLELSAPDLYSGLQPRALLGSPLDLAATALVATILLIRGPAFVRLVRHALLPTLIRLDGLRPLVSFVGCQLLAGVLVSVVLSEADRVVGQVAATPSVGAFEWPFLTATPLRVTVLVGLLLLMTAAVWCAALIMRLALAPFEFAPRRLRHRWLAIAAWVAPSLLLLLASPADGVPSHLWRLLIIVVVIAATVRAGGYGLAWFRRASQARQLMVRFATLWLPAVLLYPGVRLEADTARRHIVATRYADEVIAHPRHLQARLSQTLSQIDAVASRDLVEAFTANSEGSATGPAFSLWRRTILAADRLTSAMELYGADGALVSRFALNFPEYAATSQRWQGQSCQWEVFGEATSFGATERRALRAERGICAETPGRSRSIVGGIVVHVMLDYPVLPFISSPDPYAAAFRRTSTEPVLPETVLVIYGWGRSTVYSSGATAWSLDDALFSRIVADAQRTPFWEMRDLGGRAYDVYFSNDRQGIYAVGVPRHTWFEHFVWLAELTTLAGLVFVVALVLGPLALRDASAVSTALTLMAEVRRSFYRKLFLAFVAASVVPVLVLAAAVRTYVADRWRSDIEAEAGRTAAVAQRVIEESLDLQQPTAARLTLSDDVMVWISRVIDQDVNIFAGPNLLATSERDLYESGLLPTRISSDVFKAIAVERLPNFVGEDRMADLRYLTAAVPIRVGGLDTVLTVPLALRQQETEEKIRELDRGVNLAALVFILFGAAGGFWMAERIGDPVTRLTRATRRLASGDLTVRAMVKSADELERLVEDFNRMAEQLTRQRTQLERTHRLEAWADVARQVAHDIKNPLTPIQLSAEHLQRVNRDRGQPLSPVLDSCVESILGQVRLLRRISSEFSTFASTPSVRLAPTSLGELLHEVIDPYQSGLPAHTRIVWTLDPDLPTLQLDRTLMGRALINIVENALHAMPQGGTLTVQADGAADGATLVIADTGFGMDAEAVERLFEPYFSTKTTGTGLGMTIAKRNIDLHGGTISVQSAPGAGTKVHISLPLAKPTGPAAPDRDGT